MSAPMDTELTTYENGAGSQHLLPEDKVLVPGTSPLTLSTLQILISFLALSIITLTLLLVEVTLKPSSTAKIEDVRSAVEG